MTYHLLHNGKIIHTATHQQPDKAYNECWMKLLDVQPFSTDYAMKHCGYQIVRAEKLKPEGEIT